MCGTGPERDPGGPGEGGWIVALDVGGGSVKSGVFAPTGRLVAAPTATPIASGGDAEEILGTLAGVMVLERAKVPGGAAWRAALGFPGPFDYARGVSRIRGVAKFEALFGRDVGAELRERLRDGPPGELRFFNDALAAIVGEAREGAGRGAARVVGVTLGTGLGSAFLVAGRPVGEAAPEAGVPAGGWLYPCPHDGRAADEIFSTRGLRARMEAAGLAGWDAPRLLAEAGSGEAKARRQWAEFGAELGRFLRPHLLAFGAERVVVLGGLAEGWPFFGPALRGELGGVRAERGELGARAALEGLRALLAGGECA
jgi:glucokinase